MEFFFGVISFVASVTGAICGIGGGVIIKPLLDMLSHEDVITISFLSSCTVLAMACYSVIKEMLTKEKCIDLHLVTLLAIGSVVGGLLGQQVFTFAKDYYGNQPAVGCMQSFLLAIVTMGTFMYTVMKTRIPTRNITSSTSCIGIGLLLGVVSSFLGIGGGPINLVVLYYFFSMDTKAAATNSLYIILFSQVANVTATICTGSIPNFNIKVMMLMISGGVLGGAVGRMINRKINSQIVDVLFKTMMISIVVISTFNTLRFFVSG